MRDMDSTVRYIKRSIPRELWTRACKRAFVDKMTITLWITRAICEELGIDEIRFGYGGKVLRRVKITDPHSVIVKGLGMLAILSIPGEIWRQAKAKAALEGKTIPQWIAGAMEKKLGGEKRC